jgi:hypothetical protein
MRVVKRREMEKEMTAARAVAEVRTHYPHSSDGEMERWRDR